MDANIPQSIEGYIHGLPLEMVDLVWAARRLIREVMPETIEQLDSSIQLIAYGTDHSVPGLICGMMIYPKYINLMLARGASLPDPHGLLRGTGKKARHVRITNLADLEHPGVRQLLESAVAHHGGN